jgi:chromosome segregation ATPase
MSNAETDLYAQLSSRPSYSELESALFEGAAAIEYLTAERNQLRSQVRLQEQELRHLRTANDDLRRQIALIGDSYMKFASACATQLQHVSRAMNETEQTPSPDLCAG